MEVFLSHNLIWIALGSGATFLFTRMYAGRRGIFGDRKRVAGQGLLGGGRNARGSGCGRGGETRTQFEAAPYPDAPPQPEEQQPAASGMVAVDLATDSSKEKMNRTV